ncbi:hypothetical protein STEG23_003516 [Scotinomys teguina]
MAWKAGQGKDKEESRARQQEEKMPVRHEEKKPACHGGGHHVVEQDFLDSETGLLLAGSIYFREEDGIEDTPYGVDPLLGKNTHLGKKLFLPGLLDKKLYKLDIQTESAGETSREEEVGKKKAEERYKPTVQRSACNGMQVEVEDSLWQDASVKRKINSSHNNMALPEPVYPTTATLEYSNTADAQETNLETNLMKMREVLKEEVNDLVKRSGRV